MPTPPAIPFRLFPLPPGRHSGVFHTHFMVNLKPASFYKWEDITGPSDSAQLQKVRIHLLTREAGRKRHSDLWHVTSTGSFNLAYSDTSFMIPAQIILHRATISLFGLLRQDPLNAHSTFSASVKCGSSNYFTYNSFESPLYFAKYFYIKYCIHIHLFTNSFFIFLL